jgi:hypothetical protein
MHLGFPPQTSQRSTSRSRVIRIADKGQETSNAVFEIYGAIPGDANEELDFLDLGWGEILRA